MKTVFMGLEQDWLDGMTNDIRYIENAEYIGSDFPLKIKPQWLNGRFRNYTLNGNAGKLVQNFFFNLICRKICNDNKEELVVVFFDYNRY